MTKSHDISLNPIIRQKSGFHGSCHSWALNGHVAQLSFIETDVTTYGGLCWRWTLKSCWTQWEDNQCYLLRHLKINHCPTLNVWYIYHSLPTFTIKNEPNLGKYTIHWVSCLLSIVKQWFGQDASSRCFKFCLSWNETLRKSRCNVDGRNLKQPPGIYKTFEIVGVITPFVTSRVPPCRVVWKIFWNFHPETLGNDPIWRAYFFQQGCSTTSNSTTDMWGHEKQQMLHEAWNTAVGLSRDPDNWWLIMNPIQMSSRIPYTWISLRWFLPFHHGK